MARLSTDTIKFLTPDEIGHLLAAARANVRDRALFLIAYRHGLRASEVGLLRTEDLDLRTLRLMVHRLKGSHSGAHPLQPDEAKALRAWLREREHGHAWHDDLRCGWPVAQGRVWAYPVVMHAPLLDLHAGFEQRVEHLGIQQLVPQLGQN